MSENGHPIERPPPEPWEMQDGEDARPFSAFILYRDLPPHDRSYAEVARRVGVTKAAVSQMGARWFWQDRIRAWDQHCDAIRRQTQLAEIESMARRHAQVADGMLTEAARHLEQRLKMWDAWMQGTGPQPAPLRPFELVAMADAAVKIGRLSRGAATEVTATHVTGEITATREREAIHALSDDPETLAAALALERALATQSERRRRALPGGEVDPSEAPGVDL
jgi:hypothetical protein